VEKVFPPQFRHLDGSYDDSSCSTEQSTLDNVEIDTLINPTARFVLWIQRTIGFFHMERHFGFLTLFMMEKFVNTS